MLYFFHNKNSFLPFSTDILNYNRGLFFIFFGIVFFLACLFCCFNLASAVFTHSSFFFVLASLTAISLCFCFHNCKTSYPQSSGIHRTPFFSQVLSGVLVMGPSHQKYKLFFLFYNKNFIQIIYKTFLLLTEVS